MANSANAADTPRQNPRQQLNPDLPSPKGHQLDYAERLYLPWWGWPLPLLGAGLLAAEIHMGYPGIRAWLPYLIMLPLAISFLLSLSKTKIRLTAEPDEELWVGDAHLPLRFIGAVEVIAREHKRHALGPELDPMAFVVHRGWIGTAVRIHLTDPADPTPYWVISTRRPTELAELLQPATAQDESPDK